MPEEELTYREGVKKEFHQLRNQMQHFDMDMRNSLARIETNMETGFKGVHVRQDYANGKTNKVIMAMVGVSCLAIGMGINNGSLILKLLGV